MKVKDLNIGDVFKILSHPEYEFDANELWRKETNSQARTIDAKTKRPRTLSLNDVRTATIEVVERADLTAIRRVGDTLVLKGGDVLLQYAGALVVYRCTPKEKWTDFALYGSSLYYSDASRAPRPTGSKLALTFLVNSGGAALGRPTGSTIFAYDGRVYGRATYEEVTGRKTTSGYKRLTMIDGSKRMVIVGTLSVTDDCALHDIIQDHFAQG